MATIKVTQGGDFNQNNNVTASDHILASYTPSDGYRLTFYAPPNGTAILNIFDNNSGNGNAVFINGLSTNVYKSDGLLEDFSDNTGGVKLVGGDRGDVLIGGSGDDTLNGGDGNDMLEGGFGTNSLDGGSGSNTANYSHYGNTFGSQVAGAGVTVNLQTGTATDRVTVFGSSFNDTLTDIQNVIGSDYADILIANIQKAGSTSNTGVSLSAGGGDDILRIQGTPTLVDGGDGNDTLSVTMTTATLDDTNFKNIERVVVYGGGGVDMSGVSAGNAPAIIRSQSSIKTQAVIAGTQGDDHIYAGKGSDSLTGGLGNDRLYGTTANATFNGSGGGDGNDVMFAGSGTETFNELMAGFGRDLIYKADLSTDYVNVAGLGDNFLFTAINDGKDTLIYNGDVGHKAGTDQLVLKGISVADADAARASGHIFSAQSA